MPELPEVETIVNDLKNKIVGARIAGFETGFIKALKNPPAGFKKAIIGRRILSVGRRGKLILIGLSGGKTILVHLRMTGNLLVGDLPADSRKKASLLGRQAGFVRHRWLLSKARRFVLDFSDVRKFGTIKLADTKLLEREPSVARLGAEPLSPDFTRQALKALLGPKKIKSILLEQSKIAGIGNIYASEILHRSGIDPDKPGRDLDYRESALLHKNIKSVLKEAIRQRGTTISDYRDSDGRAGRFQEALKVYGREGEQCRNRGCKGEIKRKVIEQRSTFYCPQCQK